MDGKPKCYALGRCKYVGNRQNAIEGNLTRYMVGIETFLEVVGVLRSLLPLDSEGYPQASPLEVLALPHAVDLEEVEFFNLLAFYYSEVKGIISAEREAQARKHNNG